MRFKFRSLKDNAEPAANDGGAYQFQAIARPQEDEPLEKTVGARMPDGSRYAGVSPDTGKPMYTTPADAPLTLTFNEAKEYASKLREHGRRDWRAPSPAELKVLFDNRAAIGGFDTSGSPTTGVYQTKETDHPSCVWTVQFGNGSQSLNHQQNKSALRCVR